MYPNVNLNDPAIIKTFKDNVEILQKDFNTLQEIIDYFKSNKERYIVALNKNNNTYTIIDNKSIVVYTIHISEKNNVCIIQFNNELDEAKHYKYKLVDKRLQEY
jgi:hypothetical protein